MLRFEFGRPVLDEISRRQICRCVVLAKLESNINPEYMSGECKFGWLLEDEKRRPIGSLVLQFGKKLGDCFLVPDQKRVIDEDSKKCAVALTVRVLENASCAFHPLCAGPLCAGTTRSKPCALLRPACA